jgi:NAD(P)-dependent dehydrogenase (short-subunit alcohol dehydrogenase family)
MRSKIALVTGGSHGLGKDMALSLARKGIDVVITYHTKKDEEQNVLEEISAMKQKAVSMQLDVADIKSFDSFLKSYP